MKVGWPCCSWPITPGTHWAQLGRLFSDANCNAVAGSSKRLEAKIGGITPEVLIFSGRNEVSPPNMRLPTWRLG